MDFSLNRSFVLIFLAQYTVHYRVGKVMRKHRKLSHNHPNCFTNGTLYVATKSRMNPLS